jgi:type I restriction enzyme S subunit
MSDCPDTAPLGNSISVLSGFPFPSAQFTEGIGKPLIRIRDLVGSRTETNFVGDFAPAFLIGYDDVLIGMDGDFNVVRWKGPEALLNQRVCKVSPASDELDERFLFWWLKPHIQIVHRRTPQTTVRHLSVGDVYRIPRPALASKAQAFAAAVLDTVDEAIAKTEAVIAKLRQVRAGLLHDLLTRGLDHHGQLRDPIAHPEQFQDSPLGLIPKEWSSVRIAEEAEIQHGYAFNGRHFTDKPIGLRLLVPGNFHRDGGLYFTDDNTKYYASGYPPETVLSNGDMLIVMTDLSPMTLILGRTVLLNEPFPVLHNQRIGKFRLKRPDDWSRSFFVTMMNDDRLRRKVIREATGTTVRHTSPDRIRSGFALRPKPEEQKEVVRRLEKIDSSINAVVSESAKLSCLKSGLMTDLLTGRVRVPETPGTTS